MSEPNEEESRRDRVDISPVFISLLNKTMPSVFFGLHNINNDPFFLWDILKTLVRSMPTDMKNEIWSDFTEISNRLDEISKMDKPRDKSLDILTIKGLKPNTTFLSKSVLYTDSYERRRYVRGQEQIHLKSVLPAFYDLIFQILDKHGYLEKNFYRIAHQDFQTFNHKGEDKI